MTQRRQRCHSGSDATTIFYPIFCFIFEICTIHYIYEPILMAIQFISRNLPSYRHFLFIINHHVFPLSCSGFHQTPALISFRYILVYRMHSNNLLETISPHLAAFAKCSSTQTHWETSHMLRSEAIMKYCTCLEQW